MKKTITLVAVLLVSMLTFAQEKEQDTTRFKYKGKVITITEDDEIELSIGDKGGDEDDDSWDVNLWRGLELGVNGYFTDNNFGINNDPNNVYLELDYGRSFMINMNLWEYNTGLGTEKVRFSTGLGFRFNRYAFKSTNTSLTYNETEVFGAVDSTKSFDKNFLNATYISAPVYLTIMPGKDPDKSFHLSVGAIVNYRIGSRVKQKYVQQDRNQKDINRGHYHLNPFLLDASARIGVGDFTVFANYGLNSLFESGKGPDYTPFSAGLSLNF